MSFRETVNRNPKQTAIAVGAVVLLAVVLITWRAMGRSGGDEGGPSTRLYYTADGGKSWFADSFDKLTPFDHGGKQAVRVHVFQCAGEDPFPVYLERVNPGAHKRVAELKASGDATEMETLMLKSLEVSKPGDSRWTPLNSKAGRAVTAPPACPNGGRMTTVVP